MSSTTRPDRERFLVMLEGRTTAEHGPASRRLARALKYALRACGLKCIRAERACDGQSDGEPHETPVFCEGSASDEASRATPVQPEAAK
jgi:hypothetical protein